MNHAWNSLQPILGAAIVVVVLLALHGFWYWRHKKLPLVPDIMLAYMLRWPSRSTGAVWCGLWLILSIALGIVLPISDGHNLVWFEKGPGLMVTLTYTVLGPILLLSYIELARAVQTFFEPDTLTQLDLQVSEWVTRWTHPRGASGVWLLRIVLLGAAGFVTWIGISAVTESIGAECGRTLCHKVPWVVADGSNCRLSWIGLIYHVVLRGLNAYLAIGLMLLTLVVFVSLHFGANFTSSVRFVIYNTKIRTVIGRLILWLSACSLVGPALLLSHGIGLYLEATESEVNVGKTLLKWGLLYWMSASLVSTYFLLTSAWWLYGRVGEGVNEVVGQMYREVEVMYSRQERSLASFTERVTALMYVESYKRAVGQITRANLPFVLGLLSILVQVAGIVASFSSVFE